MNIDLKLAKPINIKLILIIGFIVLFPSLVPISVFSPCLVVALGFMVGVLIISFLIDAEDRKFLLQLFVWAYLLRILLALLLYFIALDWRYREGGASGFDGFFIGDGWGYNANGWLIVERFKSGLSIDYSVIRTMKGSHSGTLHPYDYINAAVYFIFDKSPLNMFFLNCFIGSVTIIFTYLIAKMIVGRQAGRLASIVYAFWPSSILWSTQNLKEPLTILLVTMCFYGFLNLLIRRKPVYFIFSCGALFLLIRFRIEFGAIVLASFFLHLFFLFYRSIKRNRTLVVVVTIIIVVIGFLIFLQIGNIMGKILGIKGGAITFSKALEQIDNLRRWRAYDRLAIMPAYQITSIPKLLLYLPFGCFIAIFAPFPWQLLSPSQLMVFPETLVWYCFVPYLIKGIYLSIKTNAKFIFSMIVYLILLLLMLAILEGNMGTLFRHRTLIMNFFLMFVAFGIIAPKKGPEIVLPK